MLIGCRETSLSSLRRSTPPRPKTKQTVALCEAEHLLHSRTCRMFRNLHGFGFRDQSVLPRDDLQGLDPATTGHGVPKVCVLVSSMDNRSPLNSNLEFVDHEIGKVI